MRKGDEQKRKAATAMNERSTRAHSVLILSLNQRDATGTKKLESKFFFADLGGSEQIKKSKVSGRNQDVAEGVGYVMGTRMREAVFINTGLLALKQCIKDLNEGKAYVSYQNHKLTKLLSSGLGGDAKSAVIVCCSSDDGDAVETIQALRFGEKCAKVSNDADINQAAMSDMLAAIDKEMDALEKAIQEKEHWVRNEQVETDRVIDDRVVEWKVGDRAEFRAGEGGWAKGTVSGFDADGRPQVRPDVAGAAHVAAADNIITADELRPIRVETVVAKSVRSAFKLTGAEAERKRLEELIKKRFQLTGEKVDLKLATTGFGGMYGGTVDKTGADKSGRYAKKSRKGLLIKGKKVAEWQN